MPRLPPRGRRQPVAAGRARPPDRRPRPGRRSTVRRDDAPPVTAIARNVVRRRLADAGAPRPGGGRGARGARRRRAPARGRRPWPASRSASSPRRATRCWPPGLLGPDGERLAHGLIAAAIERGPRPDRVRAPAPRGRARADGRPRGRRPRRQPPAPVPPAGRSGRQRAAGARRGDRCRRRGAAHRGGLPRARAAGARAGRRPRRACSRSWRRSPSTPACPTRSGACSTRCPRCTIARAAIDLLTRLAALNVLGTGDADHAELFERELACESDPDARLAVEAASLDALMMIPERHARARAARGGDRPARDDGSGARARRSSPTAPGSGSSSARPTRRRVPRWPSRPSRATCCCTRPSGARPTTCACARW